MTTKILINTDILIDISRGIEVAINRIKEEEIKYQLCISVITQMELILGCRNRIEQQKLNKFLRRYLLINISESISNQANDLFKKYHLSHGLLIPDAFIVATGIILNIPLLTKNQSDYRFINEIQLLSYP